MSNDPLLQPFKLKHLTLRNRLMTSSHEPAYPEDGMPKGRYRAYHAERAKAGIALTMTAGSAVAVLGPVVLKMAAVNGSDEAMDSADLIAAQMPDLKRS